MPEHLAPVESVSPHVSQGHRALALCAGRGCKLGHMMEQATLALCLAGPRDTLPYALALGVFHTRLCNKATE